jgi:DNA-binding protein
MSEKSRIVFVGNKMPMDYVLAIITGLSTSNAKEITLKARGKSITTAIDAAEITRHRFLKNLKVSKIAIGNENSVSRPRCPYCGGTRLEEDEDSVKCLDCGMGKYKKGRHKGC